MNSNRIISAGEVIIRKDNRFRLSDGYNLQIRNLKKSDAGKITNSRPSFQYLLYYIYNKHQVKNLVLFILTIYIFSFLGEYVCEIETYGSPLDQTSTLEILGEYFC